MIDSKDISVIVQGPINKKETPKCLKSIRKFLPEAEIILSTWQGTDISNLDYDILVLCEDPGTTLIEEFTHKKTYNNMFRQLVSTNEGLKKATRKYAMKLRSDLIFTSDRFLEYFNKFEARGNNYNLFKHKILTDVLFTRFNIKTGKFENRVIIPFHVSDWWLFGLKEDLDTYFMDTELVKEPEFTRYFNLEGNQEKISPYGKARFKFAPEQYFGYSCFARNFDDIYMEDAADYSEELMEKFRQALVNNFIILEFKQSGIYLNKYPYSKNEKFSGDQYIGLYNFWRYENEYKKYCDDTYEITTKDSFFENEKLGYSKLRVYKHISKLTDSSTTCTAKLEQLFIGIPISAISYLIDVIKEQLSANKEQNK